jgi:anti-anti-sigma regulatory factor
LGLIPKWLFLFGTSLAIEGAWKTYRMIRIDTLSENPAEVVLKIAGRVADFEVAFVEGEINRWLAETARLVLDLRGVKFIDRAGVAMLERRVGERLELRNGSPFICSLLEAYGLEVHTAGV